MQKQPDRGTKIERRRDAMREYRLVARNSKTSCKRMASNGKVRTATEPPTALTAPLPHDCHSVFLRRRVFGVQPCQALAVIRQADNNNHAASAFHDPRSQAGEPGTAAPTTPSLGVVALVASLLCGGAWPVPLPLLAWACWRSSLGRAGSRRQPS